jgi:hypothetical protein
MIVQSDGLNRNALPEHRPKPAGGFDAIVKAVFHPTASMHNGVVLLAGRFLLGSKAAGAYAGWEKLSTRESPMVKRPKCPSVAVISARSASWVGWEIVASG